MAKELIQMDLPAPVFEEVSDGPSTLAHRTSAHHYFVTSAHQYYDISSSKCGNQLIKIRTFAHHILEI